MRWLPVLILFCGLGSGLWAQDDKWEISGVAGGSLFRDITASASNPSRSAKVGFFNGIAAGVILGQNARGHWGGEFHYLFQSNNMRLRGTDGTSGQADFAAQSHSFHYDAVLYATHRESTFRPFIAAGPGLRLYQASGQEHATQPLRDIVDLTHQNTLKFLFSGGGGVKIKISQHAVVRFDFRDYVTGIPTKGFVTGPGLKLSGQFHNFVGTGGIGIVF